MAEVNEQKKSDYAVSLPFFGIPKILPFMKKYRKRLTIMVI